ncbi:MAG: hypothetical protein A2Y94_05130 [Caldithrix sp. RBG_13_44_9]|nr:MAG: hypothetical protein A2Y94_05130 [Caldithrix sp. RBG_13_44_9]
MHKLVIKNLLLAVLVSISVIQANGTNSFNFLQMSIGSRAQGMGNAFTAVPSDINSVYFNPASVGFSYRPTLMFFHGQLYEEMAIENFTAVYPGLNHFTLTFGLSYLHLPAIDKYDIDPGTGDAIPLGNFQIYDFVPQLGVAYQINPDFSLGMQVKYLQERIDDVTASGVAFDFGALYQIPIDFLTIGASLQNLGPKITYENAKENLPLTYRLGLAYQLSAYMVTFAFDGVKTTGEQWRFYPGLEVELMNSVAFRAGYQFQNDIGAGYNVGLGFKFLDNYAINYVYSPYGILGNTHKAEISFSFKGKAEARKSYAPPPAEEKASPVEVSPVESRNISYFLPVPSALKVQRGEDQLILSWDKIDVPEAKYYVYVELPGKSQIVRVTKEPIVDNTYTFNPTVNQINLRFYISFVKENWESELSKPLQVKYKK